MILIYGVMILGAFLQVFTFELSGHATFVVTFGTFFAALLFPWLITAAWDRWVEPRISPPIVPTEEEWAQMRREVRS